MVEVQFGQAFGREFALVNFWVSKWLSVVGPCVADRTSQKEFEVTSLTYCVFFVWLQADLLAVSFWSLAVQHNLLCNVHVEAVALPRFMRSLH